MRTFQPPSCFESRLFNTLCTYDFDIIYREVSRRKPMVGGLCLVARAFIKVRLDAQRARLLTAKRCTGRSCSRRKLQTGVAPRNPVSKLL